MVIPEGGAISSGIVAGGSRIVNFGYDFTTDGKRFLIDTTGGAGASAAPPLVTVVTNWQAGSKE